MKAHPFTPRVDHDGLRPPNPSLCSLCGLCEAAHTTTMRDRTTRNTVFLAQLSDPEFWRDTKRDAAIHGFTARTAHGRVNPATITTEREPA